MFVSCFEAKEKHSTISPKYDEHSLLQLNWISCKKDHNLSVSSGDKEERENTSQHRVDGYRNKLLEFVTNPLARTGAEEKLWPKIIQ